MRDYWLIQAIKCCGSQTELARRMCVSREKITYLLNRSVEISLHDALLIQCATKGAVSWHHLADTVDPRVEKLLRGKVPTSAEVFPARISERVARGLVYENYIGPRQGKRSDLALCENFNKVTGRTDSYVAKKSGFGSYQSYRQAKQVVKFGIPVLIEAMDEGEVSIFAASQMAQYDATEQHALLQLNRSERSARLKALKQAAQQTTQQGDCPHDTTKSK